MSSTYGLNSLGPKTYNYSVDGLEKGPESIGKAAGNLLKQLLGLDVLNILGGKLPLASAPELPAPKVEMSVEDMMLALIGIKNKLSEAQSEISVNDIKENMSKRTEENKKRLAELEKSNNKMEEAKSTGKWKKAFGWLGMVAQAVALVATTVAAVALIGTGIGAVLGAALIIAIAAQTLTLTHSALMELSDGYAKFAEKNKAFGYIVAGVQIVGLIASVISGIGLAGQIPKLAQTIGLIVPAVLGGLASLGQAVMTKIETDHKYDASESAAKAKEIEAAILKAQAQMDDEMKRLKRMLEEIQEGFSICMDIMSGATQAKLAVINRQTV